jgi:thioredoxin reductase (NADPH)
VLKRLKQEDGSFIVTSNEGTQFHSKVVAIAGGLGSFCLENH